jgi:asparagine synthase (glutamine-hydrolysing)
LVLAVAAHVARRDGFPLPIPRTRRFISDTASEESKWQEQLIRHVGLADWDIIDASEGYDVVGELAQPFLRRYGVVLPAPLFVLADSMAAARGGSHLTGEGGDEILGLRRAAYMRLVLETPRGALGRLRDKSRRPNVINNLIPAPLRRRRYERMRMENLAGKEWVRPEAVRRIGALIGRQDATEPLDWRDSLAWHLAQPTVRAFQHNLQVVARDHDVTHVDPLLEPTFVSALARCGGRFGFSSRTAVMAFLAEDLLPKAIIERQHKAAFNTAYFTATARRFVKSWDGGGLDTSIVDPQALREEWSKPFPAANSFMLLQQAWLASNPCAGSQIG